MSEEYDVKTTYWLKCKCRLYDKIDYEITGSKTPITPNDCVCNVYDKGELVDRKEFTQIIIEGRD